MALTKAQIAGLSVGVFFLLTSITFLTAMLLLYRRRRYARHTPCQPDTESPPSLSSEQHVKHAYALGLHAQDAAPPLPAINVCSETSSMDSRARAEGEEAKTAAAPGRLDTGVSKRASSLRDAVLSAGEEGGSAECMMVQTEEEEDRSTGAGNMYGERKGGEKRVTRGYSGAWP
ncbi:hypothetical protein ACEQ8H_006939 [Pleosporales sp. CAS-2024a]